MSRTIRRIALSVVAAAALSALAVPAADAASTCKLSLKTSRGLGPTYVTQLRVSRTSCSNAIKVTRSFQSCRLKKGKKGRCTTKVRGYACTERRPKAESIPTQFTGHVTCRRGKARITHDYQQDT